MEEYNILVVGVGGQGVLFISEALGNAALVAGLNVRVSEIHGMAQRGGSVICNVRLGDKVYSPTIIEKEAHLIIALEPVEALRNLEYANNKTLIAININSIEPPGIYVKNEKYPELDSIITSLRKVTKNILAINALEIADKAGSPSTQNTVMLGLISASKKLPIDAQLLKKTIVSLTKKKFQESNKIAFDLGFEGYEKSKAHALKYTGPISEN